MTPNRLLAATLVALLSPAATRPVRAQPAGTVGLPGTLRLFRLFGDGMVVQRDKPVAVWGWSQPASRVAVDFRGRIATARADRRGAWRVTLPAGRAGGPFTLVARSGEQRIEVHDVLVGDVWVASGQSNMEFTVAQANNAAVEISAANDSLIRHFKVPQSYANEPEDDLAGGSWAPADSKHVGAFTAVGYFFARELRKTTRVPVGLINSTWGGSNIETWLSRDAQHISDSAWASIVDAEASRTASMREAIRARIGGLPATDSGVVNGRAVWADPSFDDRSWMPVRVPGYWESEGLTGLDGVGWYRLAFDVTDREADGTTTLTFDAIDDDETTWINGAEVGRTAGYDVRRSYRLAPGLLRPGRNVLAVRVVDWGGGGGINGPVALTLADGAQRSLAGTWKLKIAEVSFRPDGQRINKIPSVLYNKMLNPLLPFPIKGVIWYQGESNANNMEQASAYRGQFATLIRSWRSAWAAGGDALPVLWVQLPNFGASDSTPPLRAAWATQRESMEAALSLPMTGRAIAIDVGEPNDIHPRNKKDVGARLARVARTVVYGEKIPSTGPTYRSHALRGDTVVIELANVGRGLVARSPDGRIGGFALAGADREFVWADAKIVGNRVHVWSARVARPVAVRYAWANNPDRANLYNRDSLPAVPFRTDRW
jgi:sialate O-acetylesterase